MATSINIDFDGFEFLDDSDDCAVDVSKMSSKTKTMKTALKQQPPISPIESESSSGISSLDSDDLKKQLLSSPPTISISHDEEEEEEDDEVEEEDGEGDRESNNGKAEKEQIDSGADGDDEEVDSSESVEGDENKDNAKVDDIADKNEEQQPQKSKCDNFAATPEKKDHDEAAACAKSSPAPPSTTPSVASPVAVNNTTPIVTSAPQTPAPPSPRVMFKSRDILDLSANIGVSRYEFIQYTVLPENNIACFLQNRAQYWRLGNGDEKDMPDAIIKCSSCDFPFPSINNNLLSQQGPASGKNKNSITDSLLTFLKNHHADYNTFNAMPNSININNINNNNTNSNNISSVHNTIFNNTNGHNVKRMYNNNAPYVAYQMIQQQQQQQQQQQFSSNAANGYYASGMNNWNNHQAPPPPPPMPPQQQQHMQQQQHQMNLFGNGGNVCGNNNTNGYNGAALAILNLMNPPQRNLTGAFPAMNNTSRYYNNMNTTTNNGFGLYKQF